MYVMPSLQWVTLQLPCLSFMPIWTSQTGYEAIDFVDSPPSLSLFPILFSSVKGQKDKGRREFVLPAFRLYIVPVLRAFRSVPKSL